MENEGEPTAAVGNIWKEMGRFSAAIKLAFIAILMLVLLVPLTMIRGVVRERAGQRRTAESEIVHRWGGEQVVAGPFLAVPYRYRERRDDGASASPATPATPATLTGVAYFLPDELRVRGTLSPQTRNRGIYDVTVYTADLQISGSFARPDFASWQVSDNDVLWDSAYLTMELPDMRGLREATALSVNGHALDFEAGSGQVGVLEGSMSAAVPALRQLDAATPLTFQADMKLRGGRALRFVPLGAETWVDISSDWPSPRFTGAFLPAERELGPAGFTAHWYVLSLSRNYPQKWRDNEVEPSRMLTASFGVDTMIPVDTYHRVERALKYGALFILLPFLSFFLFEVFVRLRIHAVQYLMVGAATALFYLLLLSIAENLGFLPAYLIGSGATIALIAVYSAAVLSTWRRAAIVTPVLLASYSFLYVVLQSEDLALLLGSSGLFVLLGTVMVATRNIDWRRIAKPGAADEEP